MFNIACIVIAVLSVVIGYRRGIMSQLGSVAGLFAGILLCNLYAGRFAEYLARNETDPTAIIFDNVLSYVLIFAGCYLLGRFVGHFISKGMRAMKIGFIDKGAGAIFCLAEYFLIFSIILNIWICVSPDTKLMDEPSRLKQTVVDFAPAVFGSETVSDLYKTMGDMLNNDKNPIDEESV